MSRALRFVASLVAAFALVYGFVPPAAAQQDTAAVAVNTRDGASIFRFAFSIRQVMGGTVDVDNAAVAWASCSDCRTVAVSFQIVLVQGDVESLSTDNLAVAVNYECTTCETLASAYQFVIGGAPMRLTPEGRRQLAQVHRRLAELARRQENMTLGEIGAELDAIAADIAAVLKTELEPIDRQEAPEGDDVEGTDGTGDSTTTTSVDTTATTSGEDAASSTSSTSSTSTTLDATTSTSSG